MVVLVAVSAGGEAVEFVVAAVGVHRVLPGLRFGYPVIHSRLLIGVIVAAGSIQKCSARQPIFPTIVLASPHLDPG